ncbi:hypothetical protein BN59_03122 [Legionella massiliensis]|uniref:Beta-xylosidase n=1 Tax=Legionella massiliensis TaxID=1034943 RepID=A0A078L4E9_9GAMM|nr:hypothetical protein [Legionella massiliensis]CDZ78808.1 hypothetical protein BN59_03122 [Legionella massiliensis]CEE14546.1 hypothetical protein BN1094_03122 [Legionella massiliensis]
MRWRKLGQIFQQDGAQSWRANSALTPTPVLLNEETIRVYAGFRDQEGISRIGYVDLDSANPSIVKAVAKEPVLDIGRPGCFDDNGVILGDIINHNGCWRMYYVGFQLVKRAKFLAFTGVAESKDQGESFTRLSEAPVLDRAAGATTIRAIHSARYEQGRWRIWYAAGNDWQDIKGTAYPRYNIWYTESQDGLCFNQASSLCIDVQDEEYRIGRPSVYHHEGLYYMFYTRGSTSGEDYYPGLALSTDGCNWQRQDGDFGLPLSSTGFDSIHLCYPRLLAVQNKTYCVYNGNNMGAEGFGLAELLEW